MKAYLVQLSNRSEIQVDEDEIKKVMAGITSGQPVMLRQGIFNPSFFVSIIIDIDRVKQFRSDVREMIRHNDQDKVYHGGKDQRKKPEIKLLADIFKEVQLKLTKGK